VAIRENDGNHDLINNTLKPNCPGHRRPSLIALERGNQAIDDFSRWMDTELVKKTSDWRLGG
jgi:hypothetical protein